MFDSLIRFTQSFRPRGILGNKTLYDGTVYINGSSLGEPVQPTASCINQPIMPQQEAQHLASQLDRCISTLSQTCSKVETDFLNIGDRLQSIYNQATLMTKNVQAAIEHVGLDGDDSTLSVIIRTAYRALSDFGLEQTGMAQRMKNLHPMCEHLKSMHNVTRGLGRIAKSLKMVAININIESSRAIESHDSFSMLSQEIRILSDSVASLDRKLSAEIQAITNKLEKMHQAVDAKMKRLTQLAADARAVADQAEPESLALMDRSVKALQKVGADGEAISRNTSQIVVSLQIHDNVSQRVDHIAEALADSHLVARQLDKKSLEPCNYLELVAAIAANLELQQAQLANIITDIDQAFQNSGRSFRVIGETVQQMSVKILQIAKGDTDAHFEERCKVGSMGSLQVALKKIQILIGQGDEAVEDLKTIGLEATDAVSRINDLMEQVRMVNFDIHLKSLNAFFKSIHLGAQGQAIGVLVQEMKALAIESNELVEQIGSINGTLMNQASQLQENAPVGSVGGQDSGVFKTSDLEASIRNFSDTSSIFTRHADEMVQQSQTLAVMIAAAEAHLAFLKPFAEQLRFQKEQLDVCRSQLAPWAPAVDDGTAALDRARLADRYTMQQERDIHSAILDGEFVRIADRTRRAEDSEEVGSQNEIAQQDAAIATQASELGENVELF